MAYYCSRSDITDLLESLAGSEIATDAQQDLKLREPASRWIDSVYPSTAPFPGVATNDAQGWTVFGDSHAAGTQTVAIAGGTGDPAVGDLFRVQLAGVWTNDLYDIYPPDTPQRLYHVTGYSSGVLTDNALASYLPAGTWNDPYVLGDAGTGMRLWYDATNDCARVKSGSAPTSETDGVALGTGGII